MTYLKVGCAPKSQIELIYTPLSHFSISAHPFDRQILESSAK